MGLLTAYRDDYYRRAASADLAAAAFASGEFSMQTARATAWATQLAYEVGDAAKFDRVIRLWDWRDAAAFHGRPARGFGLSGPKGFSATVGEHTILAFAGTEPNSLRDWLTAADIWRRGRGEAGQPHPGFRQNLALVWTRIATIGAAAAARGGKLFLAGHSSGGALAVLAAKRLLDERRLPPDRIGGVYTFGMPRPGSRRFAEAYGEAGDGALAAKTHRIVHERDLVPKLPPGFAPFGFRHVGQRLACEPAGTLGRLPPYPSNVDLISRIVSHVPTIIRVHLTDRYLLALGAAPP